MTCDDSCTSLLIINKAKNIYLIRIFDPNKKKKRWGGQSLPSQLVPIYNIRVEEYFLIIIIGRLCLSKF